MSGIRNPLMALALMALLGISGCRNPNSAIADLPEVKMGEEIVQEINAFRKQNGRLPKSLDEARISTDLQTKYFYQVTSSNDYEFWFGESLGESVTYDSKLGTWSRRN